MSITNFRIQSRPRFLKYRSFRKEKSSRSRCCSFQSLRMRSVVNKANTCYNDNCNKTIRGVNKMFVKTIKQNDVTSIIFPKELNVPVGADFKISITEDQNIILQPVAEQTKTTGGVSKEVFDEAYSLAIQHYNNAFKELVSR